ncbi:MAG: hypothetical protein AAB787_01485 [Patescibacteria group bacterium]
MKINRQTWLLVSVIGLVAVIGLIFSSRSDQSENINISIKNSNEPTFGTVISDEGGVEVAVTPINPSSGSKEWLFKVDLTTHSVELGEDMTLVSELILDSGEVIRPTSWEGSPPGGHHRNGVLEFVGVSKTVSGLTLKIKNVGGVLEREFKWNLK